MRNRIILGCILFTIITGGGYYLYQKYNPTTYYSDKVHVHSDFIIVINDEHVRLTDEKYQSSAEHIRHKNIHVHDGKDDVVHRHAEGITFAEFLQSIGFTLTDTCLTNDKNETFCTDDTNSLVLFVNGEPASPTTYINQEEDRIFLYYGTRNNPKLQEYDTLITNNSCFYSGTCPERGIAPPESCGLTCEL
ncbi:MAG: hypothetical protein KBC62_01260 [Candidatus Pacebacteria bacterium]|nr:hypothetical protein [Candidatus Paceibacterota bacterium]MBP9842611.1 hypothetical protein [Candidatus Paceibacterota bacterium]